MLFVERVSEDARSAATKAVEAALVEGRIIQADRDHRVAAIRGAQSATELQMVIHDLGTRDVSGAGDARWPTYAPPTADATSEPAQPTQPQPIQPQQPAPVIGVPYGPPGSQPEAIGSMFATKPKRGRLVWVLVPVVFFFFIVGGIILSIVTAVTQVDDGLDSFDDIFSDAPTTSEPAPVNVLGKAGFNRLLASLREETGSTTVFEAGLYQGYAVISVPVEAGTKRELRYRFDGELTDTNKGTSRYERFDLSRIDPAVITRIMQKAKTLIEDPNGFYVLVRKPDGTFQQDAWLSAYASNEYGEGGYLTAKLDGTILSRYVSE